ncbi:MAG TPA: DUF3795 domain-containing protein [bacterium]|nr:DUF3795 domain-containing protein [bacterium]
MPEMIAFCGIDCNACPAQIATRTNDAALREKTAAEWSKSFGHEFKPEQVNCAGCTGDGAQNAYCSMCEIRKCATGRKVATCADCGDYGCATLSGFHKNAPEAKAHLEALRARR